MRCWRANSTLPLSNLRATMRNSKTACCAAALEDMLAAPKTASRAPRATQASGVRPIRRLAEAAGLSSRDASAVTRVSLVDILNSVPASSDPTPP